jgi:hypothetical protein
MGLFAEERGYEPQTKGACMTKKETELQNRLLDVLEANTKALTNVFDIMVKIAGTAPPAVTEPQKPESGETKALEEEEAAEMTKKAVESEEVPQNEAEIDIEYCRKAMKAISTKLSKEEVKEFLAQFGGATTIPKLDKKYYPAFIEGATKIMTGGE